MSPIQDPPRPPLTDEERLWLTNKAAFAAASARGPLVLRNRTVGELEITGQAFAAVTWDGVDFLQTQFARTTFVGSRLRDVTFVDCRFEHVAWSRCRFDRCELELAELEEVRVADCSGEALALSGCECTRMDFTNCELRAFTDEIGNYSKSRWTNLRLLKPSLRGTRLAGTRVADTTIVGGSLEEVTFSDCKGRGLLLHATHVDGLDFVLGTWVAITCDGVSGRSLRLTDVQVTGLSLLGCSAFVGMAIAGGAVRGLAVDRCSKLALFSLAKVRVRSLLVSHSYIDGASWHDSTIGDDSSISQAKIAGLDLGGSTLDGVTIRDTELAVRLGLEGAHIRGLVLERIRYAPGLDLRADGVDYGPGARFPTP